MHAALQRHRSLLSAVATILRLDLELGEVPGCGSLQTPLGAPRVSKCPEASEIVGSVSKCPLCLRSCQVRGEGLSAWLSSLAAQLVAAAWDRVASLGARLPIFLRALAVCTAALPQPEPQLERSILGLRCVAAALDDPGATGRFGSLGECVVDDGLLTGALVCRTVGAGNLAVGVAVHVACQGLLSLLSLLSLWAVRRAHPKGHWVARRRAEAAPGTGSRQASRNPAAPGPARR